MFPCNVLALLGKSGLQIVYNKSFSSTPRAKNVTDLRGKSIERPTDQIFLNIYVYKYMPKLCWITWSFELPGPWASVNYRLRREIFPPYIHPVTETEKQIVGLKLRNIFSLGDLARIAFVSCSTDYPLLITKRHMKKVLDLPFGEVHWPLTLVMEFIQYDEYCRIVNKFYIVDTVEGFAHYKSLRTRGLFLKVSGSMCGAIRGDSKKPRLAGECGSRSFRF